MVLVVEIDKYHHGVMILLQKFNDYQTISKHSKNEPDRTRASINEFVSVSSVTATSCTYLEENCNDAIYFLYLFKDSISQQRNVRKLLNSKQVLHTGNIIPQTSNGLTNI